MYISIDVGGTNTRVAGARSLEEPAFTSEPLRRRNHHDFDADLQFMIESALVIADGEEITAVGIGAPGSPNEEHTEIVSAKNLSSWIGMPLVTSLSEKLGCPVYYDNDVIAAGLGEAYFGNSKGDFDYIIWGTGVGGIRVTRDDDNQPTEIDNLSWREYFKDREMTIGGSELQNLYGKQPEKLTEADWEEVGKSFKDNLKDYITRKRPESIVFGGGLAGKHSDLIKEASSDTGIPITTTSFADDSGLVGGLGLIRYNS